MANGTIAFDTLQTSGQITGTAKSLDTDFVVSGSAKARVLYDQSNNTNKGSLNIGSITDTSTGLFTLNFSNNFNDAFYSTVGSGNQNRRFQVDGTTLSEQTTGSVDCRITTESTTLSDITTIGVNIHGDLA